MLSHPPFAFTSCSDNYAVGSIANGTTFTAAANDTDGAAVSVISALAHDGHYICIEIGGISLSTANGQAYADILYDPAGGTSWSVLINDLACGFTSALSATTGYANRYCFPLWIPSGSSIGIQAKTHHTADLTTGRVAISVYGNPSKPEMWWCGQGVETLGNTDSRGTAIGSGTNAFGSWTSVGGTTTARYGFLQLGVNGTDNNANLGTYIFQVGTGSAIYPGTGSTVVGFATTELGVRSNLIPWYVDIPSGTQMQVRSGSNLVSFETAYCTLYGVY